jgi:PhnB protein
MVTLNPYISFTGEAREAMTFYQSVFGGELTMSTFGESGMSSGDAAADEQLMHAQLQVPGGLTLMAADTPEGMQHTPGDNIAISLSGGPEDEARLRGYYEKLCEGARTTLPLDKAPWGDWFGMLTDRFGIGWMVNIAGDAG